MLDVGFTQFLDALLDTKKIADKAREMALRFWQDNIKPNFASDPDFLEEIHFVPLPGVKDNSKIGLRDGFLQLDGCAEPKSHATTGADRSETEPRSRRYLIRSWVKSKT